MDKLLLAISAANAEAILDGTRHFDHRQRPPVRLPARAFLAVPGTGVVGECDLGERELKSKNGWAIPVSRPKRYRTPRPLERFGLTKTPRSFQYLKPVPRTHAD